MRLLHDCIPTRLNLVRRNVLAPNSSINCPPFAEDIDTSTHLFLHCHIAFMIWLKVLSWLEISFITPQNLFVH